MLYFLNSVVRGGVEQHVMDLLRRVDRGRFSVRLVCPPVLREMMRGELDSLDVAVDEIEIRSWRRVGEIRRLRRVLREWRPHVVHSHLYFAARYGNAIARWSGVGAVVETAHIEEMWRTGWRRCLALVDGVASRLAHRVIAVSHAVKRFYVEAKRVPAERIVVIHNGVDLERFDPDVPRDVLGLRAAVGLRAEHRVVAVVGRLTGQKGHRYLVEAVPRVVAAVPEARFVIAGRGELEGALREQAAALGVADKVVFAGFRGDAENVYAMSDVVVLPSLFEGLPLTVAEAQAMGRPVVATNVSGTPEVVLDGESGLLVEPRDVAALGDALVRVLSDRALACRMGQRGREHVRAEFSLERQVRLTEAVYREAVCGAGGSWGR